MSDHVYLYLLGSAFCLGVDSALSRGNETVLQDAVWRTVVLLLWPVILVCGFLVLWRKRGEGRS